MFFFFFFNDTATTEIYTLSLHDALPISIALTAKEKGAPEPRVLRRALFAWAFNPATRETDPPREIALALGWAARASLPLSVLDDPATVRAALGACAKTL